MGLLPSNQSGGNDSSEYTPKNFSDEGGHLELLLGASLGEEIVIRDA